MTFERWLTTALRDLDSQASARLHTEYTTHFRDALDATQDEAQALAMLGDPERLNGQLKRQYLSADEGVWLDKYADQVAKPYWGWMFALVLPLLAWLQSTFQTHFWVVATAVVVVLLCRALLLRFSSRRRAALAMATGVVPALFIGLFGSTLQNHVVQFVSTALILALIYIPRRHIWLKVLRRG